jgi:tetratricopeptide (TPR) repeat protein
MYSCSKSAQQLVDQGNAQYQAAKYADAAITFRKALQKDPKFAEARYRLGLAELAQDRYAEAFLALREAVGESISDPKDARIKLADLSLMLCYILPDQSEFARNLLRSLTSTLLQSDPASFDANRLSGELAKVDHNRGVAIEYLRKAFEKKPLHRDVTLSLAQLLFQEGQIEEAENLAKQLVAKHPDWAPAYTVLSRQYLARGKKDEAARILKERIASNPKEISYAILLAEFYANANEVASMESTLQSIQDNDAFPQRWLHIGDFRSSRKQYEEALRSYAQGLAALPNDAAIYKTRMATIRLIQSDTAEARRLIDEALAADPSNKQARLLRANLILNVSRGKDAAASIPEYQKLLADDPGNWIVLVNLARAHVSRGDVEAARRALIEAIDRNGSMVEARVLLADLSLMTRKPKIALEQSEAIMARSQDNPLARLIQARAQIQLERYQDARATLDKLAKDFPDASDVQVQLADLAIRERRYADAAAIYNHLNRLGSGTALTAAGLSLIDSSAEQHANSIERLLAELKKNPDSLSLRELLAAAYARAGKHSDAVAEYRALLQKNPDSADFRLGLGAIYDDAKDYSSAVAEFSKAAELAPTQPLPLLMLAGASERRGRTAEAIHAYRRALKIQPNNPIACNNLALALAHQGTNLDEALDLANRANSAAPNQPALRDTLGVVYLKKGSYQEALQVFQGLVRIGPSDPAFQLNLARALVAMNKTAEAKAALTAALNLKPSPEQSKDANTLLASLP